MSWVENYKASLARLSEEQLAVVQALDEGYGLVTEPLRVLATAGSGKTATTVAGVAFLINSRKAKPEDVIFTTFTKKAQLEISGRLGEVLPQDALAQLRVGTYHGLAFRAVSAAARAKNKLAQRPHGWSFGLNLDSSARRRSQDLARWTPRTLGEEAIKAMKFLELSDIWEAIGARGEDIPTLRNVPSVREQFGSAPDPKDLARSVDVLRSHAVTTPEEAIQRKLVDPDDSSVAQVLYGWKLYNQVKKNLAAWDFADLLQTYYELVQAGGDRARLFLVDEAQDNTFIQMAIARQVAKNDGRGRAAYVGDVRQSIYAFRGAQPEILGEADVTEGAITRELTRNYRSGRKIVEAGNSVADGQPWSVGSPAVPARSDDGVVAFMRAESSISRARQTAREIAERIAAGARPKDHAVLARTRAAGAPFEVMFLIHNVPAVVQGGSPFFKNRAVDAVMQYIRLGTGVVPPQILVEDFGRAMRKLRIFAKKDTVQEVWRTSRAATNPTRISELLASWYDDELASRRRVLLWGRDQEKKERAFEELLGGLEDVARGGTPAEIVQAVAVRLGRLGIISIPEHAGELIPEQGEGEGETEKVEGEGDTDREMITALTEIAGAMTLDELAHISVRAGELSKIVGESDASRQQVDEADETAADKVIVGTIHSAKGLEWPVVYLLAGAKELPHKGEDTPEERRLFYVGVTRARDTLVLASEGSESQYVQAVREDEVEQSVAVATEPEPAPVEEPPAVPVPVDVTAPTAKVVEVVQTFDPLVEDFLKLRVLFETKYPELVPALDSMREEVIRHMADIRLEFDAKRSVSPVPDEAGPDEAEQGVWNDQAPTGPWSWANATLYFQGETMGNIQKVEARDVQLDIRPWAQYKRALEITFIPKGKRKARRDIRTPDQFFALVPPGVFAPDPDAMWDESTKEERPGVTVQRGRYMGFDPRWVTDFEPRLVPGTWRWKNGEFALIDGDLVEAPKPKREETKRVGQLTENQFKLLDLIINSQYHDGNDPVDHGIWQSEVSDHFGTSTGGVIRHALDAGLVGEDASSRDKADWVVWVTQKGFDAYQHAVAAKAEAKQEEQWRAPLESSPSEAIYPWVAELTDKAEKLLTEALSRPVQLHDPIGSGNNGQVFQITDGQVVKITASLEEIQGVEVMKKYGGAAFPRVHAVVALGPINPRLRKPDYADDDNSAYAIVRDGVTPLPKAEVARLNALAPTYTRSQLGLRRDELVNFNTEQPVSNRLFASAAKRGDSQRVDQWLDDVGTAVDWYQRHGNAAAVTLLWAEWKAWAKLWTGMTQTITAAAAVRAGGPVIDVGYGNMGTRPDGALVFFDLGFVALPQADQDKAPDVPVVERYGYWVYSRPDPQMGGKLYPVTYANRSQADAAAARLGGAPWVVFQVPGGRALLVGQRMEAETEKELTHEERVMTARRLGREAFERGAKDVPALDVHLRPLLAGYAVDAKPSGLEILEAWSDGWHTANREAPVEEVETPNPPAPPPVPGLNYPDTPAGRTAAELHDRLLDIIPEWTFKVFATKVFDSDMVRFFFYRIRRGETPKNGIEENHQTFYMVISADQWPPGGAPVGKIVVEGKAQHGWFNEEIPKFRKFTAKAQGQEGVKQAVQKMVQWVRDNRALLTGEATPAVVQAQPPDRPVSPEPSKTKAVPTFVSEEQDFESEFAAAFTRLRGKGLNLVPLAALREALGGWSAADFNVELYELRRQRKYVLHTHDGRHGRVTPEQAAAAIVEDGRQFVYVARVDENEDEDDDYELSQAPAEPSTSLVGTTWRSTRGERRVVGRDSTGKYLVQTGDSTRFQELVDADEIPGIRARDEDNVRRKESIEEEVEDDDTDGFAEQFTARERGRIRKTLFESQGFSGKISIRRDAIRRLVGEGWRVESTSKFGRVLQDPTGQSLYTERDITKTAVDYAAYLSQQRGRPVQPEGPPSESSSEAGGSKGHGQFQVPVKGSCYIQIRMNGETYGAPLIPQKDKPAFVLSGTPVICQTAHELSLSYVSSDGLIPKYTWRSGEHLPQVQSTIEALTAQLVRQMPAQIRDNPRLVTLYTATSGEAFSIDKNVVTSSTGTGVRNASVFAAAMTTALERGWLVEQPAGHFKWAL